MRRAISVLVPAALAVALAVAAATASAGTTAGKAQADKLGPMPISISDQLKHRKAPKQPTAAQAEAAVEAGTTTASKCGGDDETLTITMPSYDPAHPGKQDVVFFRETPAGAEDGATLWVAWDFLTTAYGRADAITCEQLAYMQSQMDHIVQSDTKYFGNYVERPAGNKNIDVMIFNIVDESYYDPNFGSYIAGFFWGGINEELDRNMIFVDSYDWANRLGPDSIRPFEYEGTVAHELQHLIHNDHDSDEDSWIDEGMADLAIYLAGYGHDATHVTYYLAFHRTPLTVWGGTLQSYGASYLFQLYLLENFGTRDGDGTWNPSWTRHEIDTQGNSIEGVEQATGASFDDLFDSWVLANYLDDPSRAGAGDFPLGYDDIDLRPFTSKAFGSWSIDRSIKETWGADHHGNLPISRYFGGYQSGTVEFPIGELEPYAPYYGTYKGIQPQMNVDLRAPAQSGVAPPTGTHEAASGGGNELTDRMLQLSQPVGGTLTFKTWYDIETEWDYGFVEASTDGGATWTPLTGSITKHSDNPNSSTAWKNALGNAASTEAAITGSSGGWVDASFDLPQASGVLVRFHYWTDEATNGQGWFVDDVATTSGFSDGFESGGAAWNLGGWSVTTGLFQNDWNATLINPVYTNGKLTETQLSTLSSTISGGQERFAQTVDTSRLGSDQATLVFANRPGSSPFASGYQLLVSKAPASS